MMKAFESAGWPTSLAATLPYGEDVVMNLFIFFVFADDPFDGCFPGRYQLEYTTATSSSAAGGGFVRAAATTSAATESDRLVESDTVIVGR